MIKYEILNETQLEIIAPLCNALMKYQKSKATIKPELFDNMTFESRFVPSFKAASENYLMVAIDGSDVVAYVYANISTKETYSNSFATFFDMSSVDDMVGCLSQFYIKESYRGQGIGSTLFNEAFKWINDQNVKDQFIFVSNGNSDALQFYVNKGFNISHDILDGFITVLKK